MSAKIEMETTQRQRKYVESQKKRGDGLGLVFQDAFIRGMRDIGYKNTGWALAELLDNSMQAGATAIGVQFGFLEGKKSDQPIPVNSLLLLIKGFASSHNFAVSPLKSFDQDVVPPFFLKESILLEEFEIRFQLHTRPHHAVDMHSID